jgi:HEPN domain-containing protein
LRLVEGSPLDTINAVLMVVLVVILVITLYVEFKFMRPKRKDDIVKVLDRDDAYNSLTNTSAVALSLRNVGKDTSRAEVLLEKAKMEYDRKDYAKVMVTTKQAREALMVAQDKDLLLDPIEEVGSVIPLAYTANDDQDTGVNEVKKLPPNYLESKFLIAAVQSEIDAARATKDVSQAEQFLEDARRHFDTKDYSASLTCSMKARRDLEGGAPVAITAAAAETEAVKMPSSMKEQAPTADSCPKCGAEITKDDQFCGSCGERSDRPALCPECKAPLRPNDVFCRKCGKRTQ